MIRYIPKNIKTAYLEFSGLKSPVVKICFFMAKYSIFMEVCFINNHS